MQHHRNMKVRLVSLIDLFYCSAERNYEISALPIKEKKSKTLTNLRFDLSLDTVAIDMKIRFGRMIEKNVL